MNAPGLILREILHRKLNFAMSVAAALAAVTLYVFFFTSGRALDRETTRIMRDLGFNLRIVHRDTDMIAFSSRGHSDLFIPEQYVQRFGEIPGLSYNHLLASIEHRLEWNGADAILTGIAAEEVYSPTGRKSSMVDHTPSGTLHVGYLLAERAGLAKGDETELLGRRFSVTRSHVPTGTDDDIRLTASLADVQAMLGRPGEINEIKALECLCADPSVSTFDVLTRELAEIMPDARVVRMSSIAEARQKQRRLTERFFRWMMPPAGVFCGLLIGLLAMQNVRQRRYEIGVMRALGYGTDRLLALFLGRAILAGVAGALAGYALGTWLAVRVGPSVFEITAKGIEPISELFIRSLIGAPLFAVVASLAPALVAARQDPAITLQEE